MRELIDIVNKISNTYPEFDRLSSHLKIFAPLSSITISALALLHTHAMNHNFQKDHSQRIKFEQI